MLEIVIIIFIIIECSFAGSTNSCNVSRLDPSPLLPSRYSGTWFSFVTQSLSKSKPCIPTRHRFYSVLFVSKNVVHALEHFNCFAVILHHNNIIRVISWYAENRTYTSYLVTCEILWYRVTISLTSGIKIKNNLPCLRTIVVCVRLRHIFLSKLSSTESGVVIAGATEAFLSERT